MWLYLIAGLLILLGIAGGVASGGIFTIIFIPLGVIMLIVAIVAGMWGRSAQASADGDTEASNTAHPPLRSTRPQEPSAPSTPEDLVDARRSQQ